MSAYILNLLDLLFTLHALDNGAYELNPFLQCQPVMIAYKLAVVGALCWWLGTREEKTARFGLTACTAVFAAVNIWHILNLAAAAV